jgi:branched-chain amino acid transport system substrate-binding protein
MEVSKFDSRDDTPKLIEALEGMDMKEGYDFPQGDKTLRKADHQAFLREFLFKVENDNYKLLESIPKDKTIVPPACTFSA